MASLHTARFAELDVGTWHDIARLRIEVFVVEQACPYQELDGRDRDPGTTHVWAVDGERVVAYLRLLTERDGELRIGRVCVAVGHRGGGVAGQLLAAALRLADQTAPGATVVLDAQTYLAGWYERAGFVVDGEPFVEDGIPHVPMRLTRRPLSR